MSKPTRTAVLAFGLPPPAAASPPLLIEQVDAVQGLLFYHAGLFGLDDVLELSLVRDRTLGATPSALPGGLAEGVAYYVRPATAGSFRLATAVSPAAAITSFTDAGVGRFSVMFDPGSTLDIAIDEAWAFIMSQCTAHGGDVEAPVVTNMAKALAVHLYIPVMAAGDPAKLATYDSLAAIWTTTYAPYLARLFAGVPVRGATDATPHTSEASPRYARLDANDARIFGTYAAEVV